MKVLVLLRCGALSVAVCWEWGDLCPLHNKLLSVLGPLCLLHQHSPSPVSEHVCAPCVFKKQLLQMPLLSLAGH